MTCTVTIVVTNYGADEGECTNEVLGVLEDLEYVQDREVVMEDEPYVRLNVTLSDNEDYASLEETIDSCGMKCEFIQ